MFFDFQQFVLFNDNIDNALVFAAVIPVSVKIVAALPYSEVMALAISSYWSDIMVRAFIMETLNDNIDDFGAQIYEYKRIQHVIDADR